MDIDAVVAREGIRDLVTRYNSNGDSGRFEPLLELFADDAVMELDDGHGGWTRFEGRDRITTIFTGMRDHLRAHASAKTGAQAGDPAPPEYIRHYTATHQIDLVDAEHATGRLYYAVVMRHGWDHWGRYMDRYVRQGGEWRFANRRVTVDGRSALSAIPAPARP